jgi:predicted nucleic acid-binding protein
VIIVDTGGLISEVDRGSRLHEATKSLLDGLRAAGERLAISPFILAEVDYLVSVRLGRPDRAVEILEDVARGAYRLEPFSNADVARAIEVMRGYADLGVGLADASNVVLAERLDTNDILTTDERHFRVLRGSGGRPFRLLPTDR